MKNILSLSCLSLCALVFLLGCSASPSNNSTTTTTTTVAPTITSISPTAVPAGSGATTVTVTGTGFTSATSLQVGGVVETTSFVSATQVTSSVPASQLASGGYLSVIALNGSSTSASGTTVSLEVDNPAPKITQIVPATFTTGAASTTVAVTGTGFVPTTAIQVGGNARSTTYVTATQVNVILTAADLASSGSVNLTAVNPTPGGGTSAAASIAINNPAPGAITLSPATLVTGATTPTTVAVMGTNFLPTSVVQIGTSARTTTYVSATQLTFQVTVTDQATAARLSVSVVNPAPGGGTSSAAILTLAAPTPTPVLTQVQPTQLIVGSGASLLYVYGSNLTSTSTVKWNGSNLTTGYASNGISILFLEATVPANLLTNAGTASITVSSPTATPAVSNALSLTIANPPPPTLTSISPSSGPINTAATVTLSGTGFTSASTVAFNGTNVTATYVSSGQLTVALPASSVTLPGNGSFTVTTPAPGGGTTAPLVYTAYIGIVNNAMVYNPVNGLFYVSVPSSAGPPYGNSVVSVDPATGAMGTPIVVGSEPDKMAISSDGTILWVGLDGASAVQQVNLTTGALGLQFTLGGNGGIYETPGTALALAALPGAPNSVVVSATNEYSDLAVAIYDSGVVRGTPASTYSYNSAYALQVDGTRSEIYAGGNSVYTTYSYNSTGMTVKATSSSGNYAESYDDELDISNGVYYTDYGTAYDAESGSLLGTFYSSGTTVASGLITADSTLGKAFLLDDSVQYSYGSYNQIQVFNTSNYTSSSSSVIPISVSTYNSSGLNSYASRMTRWGTNGLAFRTGAGVYSVRSNLVKDLSGTSADLGVSLTSTGTNATGSTTTYTATVTNSGPAASTNVGLTIVVPATGVLGTITPSAGTCSTTNGVSCDLGGLASGATATVTFAVQQTVAGSFVAAAQVSGSENDPNIANNSASSTATITGSAYNLLPAIASISPAAIQAGASDTTITVTGTGFNSATTVLLGGKALTSSYNSSTSLTATVPAANLASMGWATVSVSNPTPGGGTSGNVPLTVFNVLTIGVNHILYEPFSRKIYASVGSGSSTITGNTIAAITPETGAVGTPVNVGSQPTKMAISDDGNIMYALLGGANSVARFNLQTQTTEFTFSPVVTNYGGSTTGFRDVAVQTGSENTVAVDFGYTSGIGMIDVDPVAKTGTLRGASTGLYTGTSLHFYNPQTLYLFNVDTWQTLDQYTVTSAGFSFDYTHNSSTLLNFGTFQLAGKLGFADAGGVANVTTTPATQIGIYKPLLQYGTAQKVAADTSLGRVFFLGSTSANDQIYGSPDGIVSYNQSTFLPTLALPLNMSTIEGNTSYTGVDLIRWGQDGLAALTSTGHIYLLRGPAVVPQLLNNNSAATLSSSSATSVTHGAGNTLLTLTGGNFVPGVAVNWNGSYRTTTIVDATHVTVAIPASDLASAGTASITAVNPGASASSALTFTIN